MRIVLADRGCILLCSMDVNFSGSKKRAICATGNRSEVREWHSLNAVHAHMRVTLRIANMCKNLHTADVYFCDMTMWVILHGSFEIFN